MGGRLNNMNPQMNFDQLLFQLDCEISVKRVFRYAGSKSIASKHIIKYFPLDLTEIVSPFLGSGTLELYLTGRKVKIHGSDLYEPLINLWNFILTDNQLLAKRAREILLKSNKQIFREYQKKKFFEIENDLDRAAYFWLFLCLSWNGIPFIGIRDYIIRNGHAYLEKYPDQPITFFDRLESFYNPFLSVSQCDYKIQLERFSNTFAYLDPPYPETGEFYGDKPEFHDQFNHEELRDVLKARNSMWVLSYNNKPLVRDLYSGNSFIIKNQWWKQGTSSINPTKEVVIFPKNYKDLDSNNLFIKEI